jgi:hypothetical protein
VFCFLFSTRTEGSFGWVVFLTGNLGADVDPSDDELRETRLVGEEPELGKEAVHTQSSIL